MPPYMTPGTEPPTIEPSKTPGLDKQTKNVILFAIIFSILAISAVAYFIFNPVHRAADATTLATTSSQTSQPAQPSLFSILARLFSPNPSGTNSGNNLVPMAPGGSGYQAPYAQQSNDYLANGTQTQATTGLTAEEQQQLYAKKLEGIFGETQATQQEVDQIWLTMQSSPLRGKVWISGVARSANVDQEYLTLTAGGDVPKETDITGFTIESLQTGQKVEVGQGVNLPITNTDNPLSDIMIYPGQTIYVNTGRSPLGYAFRVNKCTGYFNQFQTFTPGLPTECPYLNNEPLPTVPNHLNDACLNYIDGFPQCTVLVNPGLVTTNQDNNCLNFIQNHTGYQNCIDLHRYDSDFYKPTWRVYLARGQSAWKSSREVLWLVDKDGKFISQYSY